MLNSYGYNRKSKEKDEEILAAVKRHHELVESKGYFVVMTSLVGSQNYDLDTDNSDIDTFSFIFPSFKELAKGDDPKAGIIFTDDGHCNFKDIRIALNLLRKTSPNSVEYFASKYKVYNPKFKYTLFKFLDNNGPLWNMIHCNYEHMLYAMAGMAHQLVKRNMPAGKRFSHALRLNDMFYHFFNSYNAGAIIEMRPGGNRDLALTAKHDINEENDVNYNRECEEIANKFDEYKSDFKLTEELEMIESRGLALIDQFQLKLFKQYLEELNGN